jgi:hypothetical protein
MAPLLGLGVTRNAEENSAVAGFDLDQRLLRDVKAPSTRQRFSDRKIPGGAAIFPS